MCNKWDEIIDEIYLKGVVYLNFIKLLKTFSDYEEVKKIVDRMKKDDSEFKDYIFYDKLPPLINKKYKHIIKETFPKFFEISDEIPE